MISVLFSCTEGYFSYLVRSLETVRDDMNLEIIIVVDFGLKLKCEEMLRKRELLQKKNIKIIELSKKMSNMKRAYCLNLAAQNAHGDYILISDADFLYPMCFWEYLLNNISENKKIVYHFFIGKLNKKVSSKILCGEYKWSEIYEKYEGMTVFYPPSFLARILLKFVKLLISFSRYQVQFYIDRPVYDEIFGSINPCFYSRDFFFKVGGHNENFVGWGGENDDLERRTLNKGGINKRILIIVAHLWHPRIVDFKNYISDSLTYGGKKQ